MSQAERSERFGLPVPVPQGAIFGPASGGENSDSAFTWHTWIITFSSESNTALGNKFRSYPQHLPVTRTGNSRRDSSVVAKKESTEVDVTIELL